MNATSPANSYDGDPVTAPSYHPDEFTGDDGTETRRPYWTYGGAVDFHRQVLEHRDHSDHPQWHDLVDYCREVQDAIGGLNV